MDNLLTLSYLDKSKADGWGIGGASDARCGTLCCRTLFCPPMLRSTTSPKSPKASENAVVAAVRAFLGDPAAPRPQTLPRPFSRLSRGPCPTRGHYWTSFRRRSISVARLAGVFHGLVVLGPVVGLDPVATNQHM